MSNTQMLLSIGIPSLLVILSWIHNNTRLSRLEAGQDALSRRIDETVHSFHNDMMSFQATLLSALYDVRERLTIVETKQNS